MKIVAAKKKPNGVLSKPKRPNCGKRQKKLAAARGKLTRKSFVAAKSKS